MAVMWRGAAPALSLHVTMWSEAHTGHVWTTIALMCVPSCCSGNRVYDREAEVLVPHRRHHERGHWSWFISTICKHTGFAFSRSQSSHPQVTKCHVVRFSPYGCAASIVPC